MAITKLALCALLLVTAALPSRAATPTPEEIIDGFFGPSPPPHRADFYTGEMKRLYWEDPTIGQMLLPGKHYTARRLPSPADAPIYDVATEHDGETHYWYAYFVRDHGTLKLKLVRPAERKDDGVAAPPTAR